MSNTAPLPAGDLTAFRDAFEAALRGEGDADVPCGECTACCTASPFVHVGPDETAALARIPRALRFPAPGLPRGHVLLPYDAAGRCPMLRDGRCSIYDARPRTCRVFDCRLFAATGVAARHENAPIALRAGRWRFDADRRGLAIRAALEEAVRFLEAHRDELGEALVPTRASDLAVAALAVHRAFLSQEREGSLRVIAPSLAEIRAALHARIASSTAKRAPRRHSSRQ